MSDFHLKFIQCHGCNGYGKYEDMEYDYTKRAFCTKECYDSIEDKKMYPCDLIKINIINNKTKFR